MRHFARVAALTLMLAACTDIISPPRIERYEYRLFLPDGTGGFDALAFHWPRELLPVKIWVDNDSPLRPAVVKAIATWENSFLYGEFRGELVGNEVDADIVVRNQVAPPKLSSHVRLAAMAPQCRGETTFVADIATESLTLPFEVYVWSRVSLDDVNLPTCYELTVLHEFGHALGLFAHSTSPGDLMYVDPVLNGLSDRDRATAEAAYHLPATVRPERWTRGATLTLGLLLTACNHSTPATATLDRGVGPVETGSLLRLTHNPLNVIDYAADGRSIVFTQADKPTVRWRVGNRYEARSDSNEACASILPATGGSATWQYCNVSAGRGDSVNHILSPALGTHGRLLFAETVGHPSYAYFPVRWRVDLVVLDTAHAGSARTVLPLYRDISGQAIVPDDSVNWLSKIAWLDDTRFVATGGNVRPDLVLNVSWRAIVIGHIGPAGATLHRLESVTTRAEWAVAHGGNLVFVDPSLRVTIVNPNEDVVVAEGTIPAAEGRILVGLGCPGTRCVAIMRDGSEWSIWEIAPQTASIRFLRALAVPGEGSLYLSPQGRDALLAAANALYLIPDLIAP